jgi:hypothetical protein
MNDQQIRALCTLMNISAPEGTEWCAEKHQSISASAREQGLRGQLRFWLVTDDSEFQDDNDLIWGD